MVPYDWRCKACEAANTGAVSHCSACGCPASCTPEQARAAEDEDRARNGLAPKPRLRFDVRWWGEFLAYILFITMLMGTLDHLPGVVWVILFVVGFVWSYKMVVRDWRRFLREGRGVSGDS
jgi:hypothetical protein